MDPLAQIISPPPSLDLVAFSPSPVQVPANSSSSGGSASVASKRPAENGAPNAKRVRHRASVAAETIKQRTLPRTFFVQTADDDEDDEDYADDSDEPHIKTDDEGDDDYAECASDEDDDDDDDDDEDDVDDAPVQSEKKPALSAPVHAAPPPLLRADNSARVQNDMFKAALARFFHHSARAAKGFCALADDAELEYVAGDESSAERPFAVFTLHVRESPDEALCVKVTGNGSTANMAVYAGLESQRRLRNYGYVYDDATWDMAGEYTLSHLLVLCMLVRCVLTDEGVLDEKRLRLLCGPGDSSGTVLSLMQLVVEGVEEQNKKGKK
jgi:hypothetical protein